jgi:hypothetical protein
VISVDDGTYLSYMNVGSNYSEEYVSQQYASHASQQYASHANNDEFEVDDDGEGLFDAPKGSLSNNTVEEDVFMGGMSSM